MKMPESLKKSSTWLFITFLTCLFAWGVLVLNYLTKVLDFNCK